MGEVAAIGLDIAKQVFHAHGVDAGAFTRIAKRRGRLTSNH